MTHTDARVGGVTTAEILRKAWMRLGEMSDAIEEVRLSLPELLFRRLPDGGLASSQIVVLSSLEQVSARVCMHL